MQSSAPPKQRIRRRIGSIARLVEVGDKIPHAAAIAILVALCLGFSALRWLDLGSFWGAGPLWLFQTAKIHGGEIVYRDFSMSYPPLSFWLFQLTYRVLGPTFLAAQLLVNVFSIAIVLLTYAIATRLMPRLLALSAGIMAACMGDSGFMLFSLQIYTPALLSGAIGIQLMALGMTDRLQAGRETRTTALLTITGCCVAVLSKPEFMAGAVAALTAACFLALCDYRNNGAAPRKIWTVAATPVLGFAIGIGVIFAIGMNVGLGKLFSGLSGYGMGAIACPWWPTGLGTFGALGSLGEAGAIVAVLTLFWFRRFARSYGNAYFLALGLATAGAVVYVLYFLSFTSFSQASQGYFATAKTLGDRLGFEYGNLSALSYFFTKRNIFLPVAWTAIAVSIVFTARKFFFRSSSTKLENCFYLMMLITGGLSARQLFGDYAEAYANVAAPAYPFLYILLIAFLYYAIRWICSTGDVPKNRAAGIAALVTLLFVGSYAGLRTMTSAINEFRAGYQPVHTRAGTVNLNDRASIAIYSFIQDHTGPGDTLVDIGSNVGSSYYGGGVNFASHSSSPVFSVIFTDITPSDSILNEDLVRLRVAMPKFVVGTDPLQALYGLPNAWNRCPFPALVWSPHTANFNYSKRFPMIEYIRSHYTKVFQFDRWTVFARNGYPSVRAVPASKSR